jgi:AraC-like DNA-binding protein
VRDVIWISTDFLLNLSGIFSTKPPLGIFDLAPLRTKGTEWETLGELFDNGVQEEDRKEPGWETAVIGNTLLILSYLQRVYSGRSAGKIRAEKQQLTDRVTAYIESHFAQNITISDLSRHFYVSESTISHQFRQKMGLSLYRYITQRRLIAAKTHIQNGISLDQVSRDVGFADYSTFYRAFKQEFGISPRRYREMLGSGR